MTGNCLSPKSWSRLEDLQLLLDAGVCSCKDKIHSKVLIVFLECAVKFRRFIHKDSETVYMFATVYLVTIGDAVVKRL